MMDSRRPLGFYDRYSVTAPSTFPRGCRVRVTGGAFEGEEGIVLDDDPTPRLPGNPAAVISLLSEAWLDEPLRFNHRDLAWAPAP